MTKYKYDHIIKKLKEKNIHFSHVSPKNKKVIPLKIKTKISITTSEEKSFDKKVSKSSNV